jgi:hypothetical protein
LCTGDTPETVERDELIADSTLSALRRILCTAPIFIGQNTLDVPVFPSFIAEIFRNAVTLGIYVELGMAILHLEAPETTDDRSSGNKSDQPIFSERLHGNHSASVRVLTFFFNNHQATLRVVLEGSPPGVERASVVNREIKSVMNEQVVFGLAQGIVNKSPGAVISRVGVPPIIISPIVAIEIEIGRKFIARICSNTYVEIGRILSRYLPIYCLVPVDGPQIPGILLLCPL